MRRAWTAYTSWTGKRESTPGTRSSRGWGAILDRAETRRRHCRGRNHARRNEALRSKTQPGEGLERRGHCYREDGVGAANPMVPSQVAISLGWILGGQVVCHGDGRQENEYQNRQCDQLHAALGWISRRNAEPDERHRDGYEEPGEIEEQLHASGHSTTGLNTNRVLPIQFRRGCGVFA